MHFPIRVCDWTDNAARISCRDDVIGDIMCHDAASADDDVASDRDRKGILIVPVTLVRGRWDGARYRSRSTGR